MLVKLFKYELKSTARTFFPFYILLILFAGANSILQLSNGAILPELFSTARVITITGYGMAIAAVMAITCVIIIQRFYKNLLGDEGYLMFTLPVKPWQLIASKAITAVVWMICGIIVTILSAFIISCAWINISDLKMLFDVFSNELSPRIFLQFLQVGLIGVSSLFLCVLTVYASIALGHLIQKHRILSSFIAFFGLSLIIQTLSAFCINILINLRIQNLLFSVSENFASDTNVALIFCWQVLISTTLFLITNYILSTKLNLE